MDIDTETLLLQPLSNTKLTRYKFFIKSNNKTPEIFA